MRYVADIETNGLYHNVTEIHCIVLRDKDTKEVLTYFDKDIGIKPTGSISEGVALLQQADLVIGHNWIDYDIRVLKLFYPEIEVDVDKIRDTYIRSMMFNPDRQRDPSCPPSKVTESGRKQIGPHGLENWGYVVGRGKVENEDWTKLTPHMLKRCIEDVHITDLVDDYLEDQEKDWDWSRAEWIEKKFRFVMSEQEGHGWYFDMAKAKECIQELEAMSDEIDNEIMPRIPPVIKELSLCRQIKKKNGGYHTNFIKWFDTAGLGDGFKKADFIGEFSRISIEPINLASTQQVKAYLLSVGWIPTEWNFKKTKKGSLERDDKGNFIKTSPKLTEDSFESLEDNTGKLIARRITIKHRQSQIQGWIDNVRPDGRIGAGGNSCGTNTARVTHRTVVNVPKAEEGVFYGKEMRSLFTVPEGYKLVGGDLSALEDRVAGHHTFKQDKGAYAEYLLSGDVHQKVADMMGVSRHVGKTCNHALKYGAQAAKIADTIGCSVEQAQEYWDKWWAAHPSLSMLKLRIEKALEDRGFIDKRGRLKEGAFIKGLDGRKIFLRKLHSALNGRIQNAGSIVHKVVAIFIYEGIQDRWLDAHIVGNFHDEVQSEVLEVDIPEYVEVVKEAEIKVNKFFNLHIPMEIEAKVGNNWKETH